MDDQKQKVCWVCVIAKYAVVFALGIIAGVFLSTPAGH
jgi:hypothetical protein